MVRSRQRRTSSGRSMEVLQHVVFLLGPGIMYNFTTLRAELAYVHLVSAMWLDRSIDAAKPTHGGSPVRLLVDGSLSVWQALFTQSPTVSPPVNPHVPNPLQFPHHPIVRKLLCYTLIPVRVPPRRRICLFALCLCRVCSVTVSLSVFSHVVIFIHVPWLL